jgi:hypothetical protein
MQNNEETRRNAKPGDNLKTALTFTLIFILICVASMHLSQ